MSDLNWLAIGPALILAATVLLLILLEVVVGGRRSLFQLVACLGALTTVGWILGTPVSGQSAFNAMLADDGLTRGFSLVVALALTLVLAGAEADLEGHDVGDHRGEYYALMVSAALGMVLMIASTNLVMTFLGLELFSLALYLLCIFFPRENPGQEAGLKYFILSSLASAVMLYGMALLYGACGSTWLSDLVRPAAQETRFLQLLGALMMVGGLAFKLSAVPFHMWSP
ncbi:MAG: proton-conducting transporter membrane subunit, partial [Candidatus Eremiobacterota bacterium]